MGVLDSMLYMLVPSKYRFRYYRITFMDAYSVKDTGQTVNLLPSAGLEHYQEHPPLKFIYGGR